MREGWMIRLAVVVGMLLGLVSPLDAAEPAEKAAGRSFRYGVCMHQGPGRGPWDFQKVMARLDELGVDMVRRDFYWDHLQPEEGKWNWAYDDAVVDAVRGRGIDVQGVIAYTARWATTGDPNAANWLDWARAAPKPAAYTAFAASLAERYRGRVRHWEIWNEPDIDFWHGSVEQYADLFQQSGDAIHRANPEALVLNGGFAMISRGRNPTFLRDFLPLASHAHWDLWAYHDYMTFRQMLVRAGENRQAYDAAKAKMPVWINEGGFHTLNAGGEAEQAITLAKKFAAAPSIGMSAYFWYNLVDDGLSPHEPEHHFGLLRHDLSPKPAFKAYKHLIQQLAPRRFAAKREWAEDPSLWALQYDGVHRNDSVLVLWRESGGAQVPVWIEGEGSPFVAFDHLGHPVEAPAFGDGQVIPLGHAPVYVHRTTVNAPRFGRMVTVPDRINATPNHPTPFAIRLHNPTKSPVEMTIESKPTTEQLTVSPTSIAVSLPASGSREVTLSLRAEKAIKDRGEAIRITIQAPGQARITADIPIESALPIPRRATGNADLVVAEQPGSGIVLSDRGSFVSLFDGVPDPRMQWWGPDDLRAQARWDYDEEALSVNVIVQDDTHHQRSAATEIWKGDSLQFAIQTDPAAASYLEIALALTDVPAEEGWVYAVAAGTTLKPGPLAPAIRRSITRQGNQTIYQFRLPWSAISGSKSPPESLRMNFIVNDDDTHGRKGWLQLSDGIGRVKDPGLFRSFVLLPGERDR